MINLETAAAAHHGSVREKAQSRLKEARACVPAPLVASTAPSPP